MSRYNQSSGSQTQTYRAIVVGGGGVGKSAITIQFIQVSGIQIRKSFSIDKYKYRCTWSIYIRFVKQDPWSNNRNIPKRRIKASSKPIRWMKCFHIERLCVLKKKNRIITHIYIKLPVYIRQIAAYTYDEDEEKKKYIKKKSKIHPSI